MHHTGMSCWYKTKSNFATCLRLPYGYWMQTKRIETYRESNPESLLVAQCLNQLRCSPHHTHTHTHTHTHINWFVMASSLSHSKQQSYSSSYINKGAVLHSHAILSVSYNKNSSQIVTQAFKDQMVNVWFLCLAPNWFCSWYYRHCWRRVHYTIT
jgi:putative hemolysin